MEVLLVLLGLYFLGSCAFLYSVWDSPVEDKLKVRTLFFLYALIWPIILILYLVDE